MLAQALISEREALEKIAQLNDYDAARLHRATRTVVNTLFKQQFGTSWWDRRLILGANREVWRYHHMFSDLVLQMGSGAVQAKIRASSDVRIRLLVLAGALRAARARQGHDAS